MNGSFLEADASFLQGDPSEILNHWTPETKAAIPATANDRQQAWIVLTLHQFCPEPRLDPPNAVWPNRSIGRTAADTVPYAAKRSPGLEAAAVGGYHGHCPEPAVGGAARLQGHGSAPKHPLDGLRVGFGGQESND